MAILLSQFSATSIHQHHVINSLTTTTFFISSVPIRICCYKKHLKPVQLNNSMSLVCLSSVWRGVLPFTAQHPRKLPQSKNLENKFAFFEVLVPSSSSKWDLCEWDFGKKSEIRSVVNTSLLFCIIKYDLMKLQSLLGH